MSEVIHELRKDTCLWITSNGDIYPIRPSNTKTFTLKEMQGLVGGFIEKVSFKTPDGDTLDFWMNEEGKLNKLPLNDVATKIYDHLFKTTDTFHGNIILCHEQFTK